MSAQRAPSDGRREDQPLDRADHQPAREREPQRAEPARAAPRSCPSGRAARRPARPIGACGAISSPAKPGQRAREQERDQHDALGRDAEQRGGARVVGDRAHHGARAGHRQHPLDQHARRRARSRAPRAPAPGTVTPPPSADRPRRRRAGRAARTPAARTAARAARGPAAPRPAPPATQPSTSPRNGRTATAYTAADSAAPAAQRARPSAPPSDPAPSGAATGIVPITASTRDEHRADDDVAVRERQHAGQPLDQREAERDQPVGGARGQPGHERLDRDRPAHLRRPCTGSAACPSQSGDDLDVDRVLAPFRCASASAPSSWSVLERLEAGALTSSSGRVVAARADPPASPSTTAKKRSVLPNGPSDS